MDHLTEICRHCSSYQIARLSMFPILHFYLAATHLAPGSYSHPAFEWV
jgi:hypothetical protein